MSYLEVVCKECAGRILLNDEQVKGHRDFYCRRCYDKVFTMRQPLLRLGEHLHVGAVVITFVADGKFTAQCVHCDYNSEAGTQAAITWVAFCHNLVRKSEAEGTVAVA